MEHHQVKNQAMEELQALPPPPALIKADLDPLIKQAELLKDQLVPQPPPPPQQLDQDLELTDLMDLDQVLKPEAVHPAPTET